MARGNSSGGTGDKGKIKFKYVEFELDGSDSTLQESLRSMASAIMRSGSAQSLKVAQIPSPNGNRGLAPSNANEVDQFEEERLSQDEVAEMPLPASKSGTRRGPPKSPQLLDDVEFSSAEVTLKALMGKAKLKEDDAVSKRYLVIAYWYKVHGNTENVTMDHIHTAFRHLGWKTPRDAGQPLRDMKQKQDWLSKGEGTGEYRINHIGEGVVLDMVKDE